MGRRSGRNVAVPSEHTRLLAAAVMLGCGLCAHLSAITGPTPLPPTAFTVAQELQEAVHPIGSSLDHRAVFPAGTDQEPRIARGSRQSFPYCAFTGWPASWWEASVAGLRAAR
jgi:hypothetical protein